MRTRTAMIERVAEYIRAHPDATIKQVADALGIHKATAYRCCEAAGYETCTVLKMRKLSHIVISD